jgi:4-hydroxy-3-polyprenylbenzoate decarboxylase
MFLPATRGHALDPSATPEFNQLLAGPGITCKTVFDCTVPWGLEERFERSQFMDVDLERYDIK